MKKLCTPPTPKIYEINCLIYFCNSCGNIFSIALPNYDGLVSFKEIDGKERKWLSMYESGGYLDLLSKLVPEYYSIENRTNKTSMEMARAFIIELNKHCEKGKSRKGFDLYTPASVCPYCAAEDCNELHELILINPKLSWLKIDSSLLE